MITLYAVFLALRDVGILTSISRFSHNIFQSNIWILDSTKWLLFHVCEPKRPILDSTIKFLLHLFLCDRPTMECEGGLLFHVAERWSGGLIDLRFWRPPPCPNRAICKTLDIMQYTRANSEFNYHSIRQTITVHN